MSQHIRFRAWDASEREMVYHEHLIHDPDGWLIALLDDDGDEGDVLMRWTELTDRTGKEIYEGDIIKHHETFTDHDELIVIDDVYSVVYNDHDAMFERSSGGFIHSKYAEVIGNIYETSELLK